MEGSPIVRALRRATEGTNARAAAAASAQPDSPEQDSSNTTDGAPHAANITTAPSSQDDSSQKSRKLQNVIPDLHRFRIVSWMVTNFDEHGKIGLMSRTICHFPQHFRSTYNANIVRASRYWKSKESIIARHSNKQRTNDISFSMSSHNGIKRHLTKARPGRGRKRARWVQVLYPLIVSEFDLLRKTGVRFDSRLLRQLALDIISKSTEADCNPSTVDDNSGLNIREHIKSAWIGRFMQLNNIVGRTQTGKLLLSPAKMEIIHRNVAYHIGQLARDFRSGRLREEDVFNADETHCVIHLHTNRTLAIRGEGEVKYADVVSGDEGMTLMVLLGGGCDAEMGIPLIIFKNSNRSYPIRGLPDETPGITYRSSHKGWMDSALFADWLNSPRIFKPLSNNRTRVIWVDNCSAHKLTPETKAALNRSRTELRFFPACATDLVQPADSFVIQRIKAEWRLRWDKKVMDMISNKMWTDPRAGSGRLINPGKQFFLSMAADVVRTVGQQRDKDGILYTRKALVRCGMALNLNGLWEERQLSPELQNIVKKFPENFNGQLVTTNHDLEGEATESDDES